MFLWSLRWILPCLTTASRIDATPSFTFYQPADESPRYAILIPNDATPDDFQLDGPTIGNVISRNDVVNAARTTFAQFRRGKQRDGINKLLITRTIIIINQTINAGIYRGFVSLSLWQILPILVLIQPFPGFPFLRNPFSRIFFPPPLVPPRFYRMRTRARYYEPDRISPRQIKLIFLAY